MATTDTNGMVFYGPTDPVEPLQGLFNGISTAVSSRLGADTQIRRINNVAGRTAAVAGRAGRPITAADPLIVWRMDAINMMNLEATTNGSDWYALNPPSLSRKASQTASGTLSSGNSVLVTPNQTISARPFGVRDWQIQHSGNMQASVPAGLGVRLELLLNNSSYSQAYWTNPGSSAHTVTLVVNDIIEVTGTSTSNLVLGMRVTAVGGTITVTGGGSGQQIVASTRQAF